MSQRGAIPILILVAIVGIIAFLVIASFANFADKMYSDLFPKPASHAAGTVYWSAGAEIGNLDIDDWQGTSEWQLNGGGGEYNSGIGDSAISTDVAHSGTHSVKATITTPNADTSGTRLFRWAEPRAQRGAYYSSWYFIPQNYSLTGNPSNGKFWDLFQFKSRSTANSVDPFWFIDAQNAPADASGSTMKPALDWWAGLCSRGISGPHQGECGFVRYQPLADVRLPIGRWFHLESYLYQSKDFDGQIKFWLDGQLIFDQTNVRTGYNNCSFNAWCAENEWSINNYSDGLIPNPSSIYFDDAVISATQQWPTFSSPSPSPSPAVLPGDIDGNRKVDIFDYNFLITDFGNSGQGLRSDLDGNNKVDIFDYNILLTNFGKTAP